MLKINKLNQALRKEENFIDGTCLFNMCPEGQKEPYQNRFWIIELFELVYNPRKIGVMIWDSKKEKLYGPCALKNTKTETGQSHKILLTQGNKIGVFTTLPIENTLEGYKFIGSDAKTGLYLYFAGQVDYCISGFDDEEPTFKKV